jgi:hypothetical protein
LEKEWIPGTSSATSRAAVSRPAPPCDARAFESAFHPHYAGHMEFHVPMALKAMFIALKAMSAMNIALKAMFIALKAHITLNVHDTLYACCF